MKIRTVILMLLFLSRVNAQPLQWQWARSGQDANTNMIAGTWTRGSSVCVDAQDNVYMAGSFYDILQLDTITLSSAGAQDIFLAKYDHNGQLLWAKDIGGKGDDEACAVQADAQGNVYIGAYFSDTIIVGTAILASMGYQDILIAKYSTVGDAIWAKSAGGPYGDMISYAYGGMKLDNAGYLYIAGQFGGYPSTANSTATFENTVLNATSIEGSIFLAKYDTSGHMIWARSAGGRYMSVAFDIEPDMIGDVFITGMYTNPNCYFDTISLTTNATFRGVNNMFLAKYDNNGSVLWVKQAGGARETFGTSVLADIQGNSYVTGYMSSNVTLFDNFALPGSTDINNGFIAKYDTGGRVIWAKNMNINLMDYNNGDYMAMNDSGDIFISGQFEGHSYLNDTISSSGSYDAFVAKYDSAGNGKWLVAGGGQGPDEGLGIAVDNKSSVYTTGYFSGSAASFGTCSVSGTGINPFVAKLSASTGVPQIFKPANNIAVYPVPSNESVTVDVVNGKFSSLKITDCVGRVVCTGAVTQQKTVINTTAFAGGVYFVTVSGSEGSVNEKIIVQH